MSAETVVLITGANQGVGRSTAVRLAKEYGYFVLIGARDLTAGETVASELRAGGYKAKAIHLDLNSDETITAAVQAIDRKFGRLDVLINNAGILLDRVNPLKPNLSTRELFRQTFATNVEGTACVTEAMIPLLRKAKPPVVVFLSSIMGSLAQATIRDTPFFALDYKAYDASKAAVNILALNYARILEDVGGVVNVVCPGLVKTNLTLYMDGATSPEEGAERTVELVVVGKDGPHATFSNKYGPLNW